MSPAVDVFVADPEPIPSAVPRFEEAVGPATSRAAEPDIADALGGRAAAASAIRRTD
ncbi:hypothetical protein [Streptomyces sp. NPDC059224]|uniref:hypothetical protein n=1 Tax=Streptomyces sp. NPDC059224 TaxID=3346775 RepID=UPI0036829ACA